MMNKTELRDPADLRLHPLRKGFTALDTSEAEQWNAFVDGMSAAGPGGIPPLFITADGRVMDGARRLKAAKQLGWVEVACMVRPEEDAGELVIDTLFGQRNLTRCVKTYLAICILDEFVKSSENRRLRNLQKGLKTLEKPLNGVSSNRLSKPLGGRPEEEKSTRVLAEKFGVSRETVRRAIQVVELFAKEPELKAKWEPLLMTGEKNLWNVLSAVGGAGADQSKRTDGVVTTQLTLAFERIGEHAEIWADLPETERQHIVSKWRATAAKIPKPLRKTIIEILQQA